MLDHPEWQFARLNGIVAWGALAKPLPLKYWQSLPNDAAQLQPPRGTIPFRFRLGLPYRHRSPREEDWI